MDRHPAVWPSRGSSLKFWEVAYQHITTARRSWSADLLPEVDTSIQKLITDKGHLKVSFFGPFYGAYVIVELDPEYRHALVSGPNRGFLWILARSPHLSKPELDRLIARAAELDFPTDDLIFVAH